MADYYYICGACNKNLNEKAPSIGCVCCKNWIHLKKGCASLSWKEAKKLNGKYICPKCVAESGGDGEAVGKEIADEDYARNVFEDDQEGDFDLYDHADLVMKGRRVKNTGMVHGKPIPEGHCKFLVKEIVNEWAEFDEDYHCAGAYLTWPSTMTLPSKKEVEKERKKKRKEKEAGRKDDKNKNADGICMMQPSVTTSQPEPMDCSESDVDIDSDEAAVPYEMISSKGHI